MKALLVSFLFLFTSLISAAQDDKENLQIAQLVGDFYVYTTYGNYENSKVPANGMYLVTTEGVFLFDTPWDSTQFQPLLDSISSRHHKPVVACIATHWHADRTLGLDYYRKQGIKTYTTTLTDSLSAINGMKRAEFLIRQDSSFQIGKYSFQTFYPGEGHTKDNIIVWFPKEKILYGGCLIKGADAQNLGYLGDANSTEYYQTLRNVQRQCPDPKYILISHSDWHDLNSLQHSIELAKELKRKAKN